MFRPLSDLTPERLAELRRIAEAATPGPWQWAGSRDKGDPHAYVYAGDYASEGEPDLWCEIVSECPEADAQHIAAFDPTTALALLDRIEALEHKVVEHWEHCPPKERCEKCGFDPRLLSTLADRLGGVNDAAHKLWTTIGNVRADLLDAAWHMAWRRQRDDEGERSC